MQYPPCCVRTIWFYFRHSTLMWARDPTGCASVDSGPVLTGKETEPNLTGPGGRVSGHANCRAVAEQSYFQVLWFSFYPSRILQPRVQFLSSSLPDDVSCFCNGFLSVCALCFAHFRRCAARQMSGSQVSVVTSLFLIVVILCKDLCPQTKTNLMLLLCRLGCKSSQYFTSNMLGSAPDKLLGSI